jgi:hypothetical protein
MQELSVAVNTPDRTPPKMMKMSMIPGTASTSARPTAAAPGKTPAG